MGIDERLAWCPKCKIEYYAWAKTCSDCLVDLVSELPVENHPLKNNPDLPKLLVSLADESEAEAIISLLAFHNITATKERVDDDTDFGIGLFVSESLIAKALAILQREDDKVDKVASGDKENEIISEREVTPGKYSGYTGRQLFKESFADKEDMLNITIAPGKKFLKVTGILYVILGGLGMVLILNAVRGTVGMNITHGIAILVQNCLFLLTGIVGIKHCNSVLKADIHKKLAYVNIVAAVAMSVFTFVILPHFFTSLFELSSGLALAVIYLIGASKNEAANLEN